MATLEELKQLFLEKSSGDIISVMGNDTDKDWLVSPAHDLNRILSGSLYKSVQAGNHTALIGPETSGKSSIMALLLADAQKKGYLPVIINAEGAWTSSFCLRWGLDPENIILINSMWIDEITPKLAEFVDNKFENLAIAVDSIGALELRKVIKDGLKGDVKADQGRLQKDIKRMLKVLVGLCKFQNCIVFSAGHYYGNSSGYGNPEEIGGGKYYRLSADTMVSLKKSQIFEFPNAESKAKKGKILGTMITAATLKNRLYPPFQEAVVEIDYQKGVNKIAGLVNIAMEMGIIVKGGAWFTCDVLDLKVQGESNFYKKLNEIDTKPLLDLIEEYLKTTGYSTINKELEYNEEVKNEEIVKKEIEEDIENEGFSEKEKTEIKKSLKNINIKKTKK